MQRPTRQTVGYLSALAACFLVAVVAGLTPPAAQIDNDAYDWMFRMRPPEAGRTQTVVLAIDDASLQMTGGMRHLRSALAEALERVAAAKPRAVALDITLADAGDEAEDARLEAALSRTPNLVLPCDLVPGGWQEPLGRFRRWAAAVGHVHAEPDDTDAVSRQIPLERVAGHDRRWALALETFRLARGGQPVVESPSDVEVGGIIIPARAGGRLTRIRFLPSIPRVSLKDVLAGRTWREQVAGKVVFVGIVSQSGTSDRWMTPLSFSVPMPGVEIHAHVYETIARGRFLTDASAAAVLGAALAMVAGAGLIFGFLAGWPAYIAAAALLAVSHAVPYVLFTRDIILPYFTPVASAWLAAAMAASYQHFIVRRQLRKSEEDKTRYQQAIHFVTHEMRTPLTAIQGSSEIMSRYALSEEKRKQIAQTINTESKRLARMIQTFLDVERLTEGQMDLRKERFPAAALAEVCLERARPLAERKRIRLLAEPLPEATLAGDRELMEYALYNLITNAIKYSPADTEVAVGGRVESGRLRLWVRDQGIGMDEKELKNIFRKFYRTKKAEASGEAGTGIGLSIVAQIVTYHGGKIEVSSSPGAGSCFTLVVPATS